MGFRSQLVDRLVGANHLPEDPTVEAARTWAQRVKRVGRAASTRVIVGSLRHEVLHASWVCRLLPVDRLRISVDRLQSH